MVRYRFAGTGESNEWLLKNPCKKGGGGKKKRCRKVGGGLPKNAEGHCVADAVRESDPEGLNYGGEESGTGV